MKKILFKIIIPALFLTIILISGCIDNNTNNKNIKDAEISDLELSISMDNAVFSNESTIIIKAKLKNIAEDSIKINKIFTIASNIRILITPPDNIMKVIFPEHGDFIEQETLILESNEFIETTFDINNPNMQYYYRNESVNKIEDFNIEDYDQGLYKLKIKYVSIEPEIYSNELEFEIT